MVIRHGVIAALALLAAAAIVSGRAAAQPPRLSDAKVNGGVARAHLMPVQGIDVSAWQGDIDWERVRAAGTQFVYIKATEGGDHLDPKFLDNWYGAKRAGIPRGAYHFVYWCRPASEQALWFMLNVPQDADALPPVLDVEWNGHSKTCPKRIPRDAALEKIKILLDALEAHTGKQPIIYTDPLFHREVLAGAFSNYRFWLRSVAAEPDDRYWDQPYMFWQFTTTGRVPGIQGEVDRNVFNGPTADWNRMLESIYARR